MKSESIHISEGAAIPAEFARGAQVAATDSPDARAYMLGAGGDLHAWTALWWRETPEEGVGVIGGFHAIDADAARRVLEASVERLRQENCIRAVGPMDGNTWRSYRFVEESDGREPFLLEPRNPAEYPRWWREAGFTDLYHYSSSVIELNGQEVIPPRLKARLLRSGLVMRAINLQRYEDELRVIHGLSSKSFSNNVLYAPPEEELFLNDYLKMERHVDPELVRIAERDGVPCGFVFGIPDLEAAARGGQPALIVKTLAVDPSARSAGLGSLLVDELHRIGRDKGYAEAIHALQHENNTSLKITGRHGGHPFRKYVVFSKLL